MMRDSHARERQKQQKQQKQQKGKKTGAGAGDKRNKEDKEDKEEKSEFSSAGKENRNSILEEMMQLDLDKGVRMEAQCSVCAPQVRILSVSGGDIDILVRALVFTNK